MKLSKVDRMSHQVPALKIKPWIVHSSLACLTILSLEALQARSAMAAWVNSLYAGQHDWITYTLRPGYYTLTASTLLNLGDVDITLYDTNGQVFLRGRELGGETLNFTVPEGSEGDFQVKYSMALCVNPMGACAVNLTMNRR